MNRNKVLAGAGISTVLAGILANILFIEGGYVDHPDDPGGATNYGITERVARAHGYEGPMEELPLSKAQEIYYTDYIFKPNFHLVVKLSHPVGAKVIDAGVNVGPKQATRWLQRGLNALSRNGLDYPLVVEDGLVGHRTLEALYGLQTRRGEVKACELLLKLLDAYQTNHYLSLKHSSTFIVGWVDHRIGNVPLEDCNSREDFSAELVTLRNHMDR